VLTSSQTSFDLLFAIYIKKSMVTIKNLSDCSENS
jgi:hypothetical protein